MSNKLDRAIRIQVRKEILLILSDQKYLDIVSGKQFRKNKFQQKNQKQPSKNCMECGGK